MARRVRSAAMGYVVGGSRHKWAWLPSGARRWSSPTTQPSVYSALPRGGRAGAGPAPLGLWPYHSGGPPRVSARELAFQTIFIPVGFSCMVVRPTSVHRPRWTRDGRCPPPARVYCIPQKVENQCGIPAENNVQDACPQGRGPGKYGGPRPPRRHGLVTRAVGLGGHDLKGGRRPQLTIGKPRPRLRDFHSRVVTAAPHRQELICVGPRPGLAAHHASRGVAVA